MSADLNNQELNYTQPPSHPVLLDFDPDENFFNDALGSLGVSHGCKYYSVEGFNETFRNAPPSLDVVMHNIRSYNKNNDAFAALLSSMCKIPEIIVLTETWLSPIDNDRRLLDGYTEFNTVRSVGRGGGCLYCAVIALL